MSQLRDKLLRLTALRYETFPLLMDNLKAEWPTDVSDPSIQVRIAAEDPVARVLKCHLLSEVVLDKLLSLALEPNGEAVLSARLSYVQKLDIASHCILAEDWNLLPDFVVGSLRQLNRIRNRLAHELGATVTREEATKLFMGIDHPMPIDQAVESVSLILVHYTAFIFGNMLPKYEEVEENV